MGVLIHTRFDHVVIEIIALASALSHTGKHRIAAMRLGNIVDQLHENDGLADAGAAEQADLAAPGVGSEQIDDFHPGNENLGFCRLFDIGRRVLVNGPCLLVRHRPRFVDRLAYHVNDAAERAVADRHRDRLACIGDFLAAH